MLELTLPRPPSVNGMYATNFKTKRRFKSKKYSEWLLASEAALMTQRLEGFLGPIQVDIAVGKQDKRKEDISNRIKAVEDFLVSHKIIEDDSLITRVSAWWDKKIEGCLVIIKQED
jgi:Holliday junction resolvase RusA-like endonuclease